MIGFYANILHKKCDISVAIEQKCMTFDHKFSDCIFISLTSFFRREEKGGKEKPKSRSKVMPFCAIISGVYRTGGLKT